NREGNEGREHAIIKLRRSLARIRTLFRNLVFFLFIARFFLLPMRQIRFLTDLLCVVEVQDGSVVFRGAMQDRTDTANFGWTAAPGGVNQADGNIESLLEIATKIIGHGAKTGDRLRIAFNP